MKIREVIAEADVSDLGKMDPKMADILGKVRDQDIEDKAKADAERAAKGKAKLDKIMALAKKHGYDLDPASSGYFMTGVNDGKRGYRDRGAGDAYGPHVGAYDRGVDIGMKIADQGLEEGGFFDPDQPNPGDMVKHRNGAVGKVKKIGTQGDETFVYFRDQNGEMNYGQWKKHVFPVKDGKGLEEATAGASVSSNFGTVEAPHLSPGSARGKKSYLGKPGGHGGTKAPPQPKVKQPKKKDGTAVNALDMGTSLFGKGAVKR